MSKNHYLCLLLAFMFAACSQYDDTAIKEDISGLQGRVTQLEKLCAQINQNAASLQTIVTALQNRDAVTGVTPKSENGVVVGYTISFEKASPVTIYNGKDGEDGEDGTDGEKGDTGAAGHTPVIGVKLFEGVYYWTVDGEFITSGGDKINAQARDGTDGNDAVTPQFRITDGRWELSTDGGSTWTDYGAATGNSGSSFFKSVDNSDEDELVLTLNDDSTIRLPKYKAMALTLTIEEAYGITAGGSVDVPYAVTGGGDAPKLTIFTQNGWKAVQTETTATTGTIRIIAPADMAADKVVVIAEDGTGKTVMRTMTFAVGTITLTDGSLIAGAEETTLDCPLTTNTGYTVDIPADAQTWLSVAEIISTRAMRDDVIKFTFTANTGLTRYTTVRLVDNGSLVKTLFVMQNGAATVIDVATAGTLSTLVPADIAENASALKITGTLNAGDYTYLRSLISGKKLTEIDLSGLSDTGMPSSCFKDATKLTRMLLPSGLAYIPEYAFHNASSLVSVNIPSTVTEIRQYAFAGTPNLATTTGTEGELFFPDNLVHIRDNAFCGGEMHGKITKLTFGSGLKSIGKSAFASFDYVEEVTFNEGLETIGDNAFHYLGKRVNDTAVTSPHPAVVFPNSLKTIGDGAFRYARLASIDFGTGVRTIGNNAFTDLMIAGDIVIPESVTVLGSGVFYNSRPWDPVVLTINADVTVIPESFCYGAYFKQVVLRDQVAEIGRSAFRGMKKISTPLLLPSGLIKIGDDAFYGSTFTGTLNFPAQLEAIGGNAFRESLFTGNLVIPNTVTSIGRGAFIDCTGFNGTLTIGTGITRLNGSTFYGCTGLTGDIYIPDNIRQISEYEFYGCTGFNGTLRLPDNPDFKTLYGWAFYGCNNLTGTINFPSSLTWVGGYSFYGCTGFSGDLVIPDNIQTIDLQAFLGCTGLNGKLVLGSGLTSIRSNVFANCNNITLVQSRKTTPPSVDGTAFYGMSATQLQVPVGAAAAYGAATTWNNFAITEVSSF